jgi:cellulose synthase/poly-beta-1,6-N-acetylglucosamine synthase-like glycosyltransferase
MDSMDSRGAQSAAGEVSWSVDLAHGAEAEESAGRQAAIRTVAVAAIGMSVAYLGWRVTSILSGATWWLALPLLGLELHALVSLALYTFDLWDLRPVAVTGVATEEPTVGVLIPTYNEPREVLLPTIAAAVALRPAHQTWVLDDGRRPWVADLAARLGATYRTRVGNDHAKAGNINAALPDLDVDLIAVFDADHIAHADFFTRTVPYFADPGVGLVQTPQDFYNVDSFEHVRGRRGRRFGEQELFYRVLAAGRNRWNAAFWCGTNAVVRLSALREVGGMSTDSITEDIHTTIRMHRRGWRTVYLNEVLALGLAAGNIEQYLGQRLRWGTGAMQVLRIENPAVVSGLTAGQRLSYLSTLLGWFDSWRMLGYLVLPLVTVLTGALPMSAPLRTFLPWFAAAFVAQRMALRVLSRGRAPAWYAIVFEIIRLPANLRATLALASRRRQRGFAVTAKGRSSQLRNRMPVPPLLSGLLAAHAIAFGWYVLTALHHSPVRYRIPWTAHGAALWMVVNATLLVVGIRRIRSPQFAAERRASVRFPVRGEATLDGVPGDLQDISLTGAALTMRSPTLTRGQHVDLTFTANHTTFNLPAVVRSVTAEDTVASTQVGLDFSDLPEQDAAALALELFRTGIAPTLQYA